MTTSNAVRLVVAVLLFLLGVAALDDVPSGDLFYSLRDTSIRWLLIVPPVLVLLVAYGLFRRRPFARFAMYALMVLNLGVIPVMALTSHWEWHWIVALALTVAATIYVHRESKSAPQKRSDGRRFRESGFAMIYVVAVLLCLLAADLAHGPRIRTLSGPVSVVRP